jgi:hypothetical protein
MRKFSQYLKIRFKDVAGCSFFYMFRWLERRLSRPAFYSIVKPIFLARATLNSAFKKTAFASSRWPRFLRVPDPARAARRERMNDYLNHIVEFFPERLAGEKWMKHCRIEGLGPLQLARQNGRPVILAYCHFGPYFLLRFWLRSAGVPVATLVGWKSGHQARVARLKYRFLPFPETPVLFYQDQLRALTDFIAAGNVVLIPVDSPSGKQITVPFCDGWTFQMATGAVRLAANHQAELIPCSIINEGPWSFCIKLGRPAPREFLATEAGWPRAAKHLLDEMRPAFQAFPEQCRTDLTRCLKPDAPEDQAFH